MCGDYVSVADVGGKQCHIYNGKDEGVTVETSLPIVRAKWQDRALLRFFCRIRIPMF